MSRGLTSNLAFIFIGSRYSGKRISPWTLYIRNRGIALFVVFQFLTTTTAMVHTTSRPNHNSFIPISKSHSFPLGNTMSGTPPPTMFVPQSGHGDWPLSKCLPDEIDLTFIVFLLQTPPRLTTTTSILHIAAIIKDVTVGPLTRR